MATSKSSLAHSYSSLNLFETCPKKFYHLRVLKDVKEEEGEALVYGKEVHKALELRVTRGTPLPLHLRHLEELCVKFEAAPGEKSAEVRLAVNRNFAPTAFFAKDVFFRAVLDLSICNKNKAVVVDWKTGSRIQDDFTQLRVGAAMLMQHMPEVEEVKVAFIYTSAGSVLTDSVKKDECVSVWSSVMPRTLRVERALSTTEFPARPSGLCRRHCPVRSCPHHGVG